jgi:hypothetical protein
MHGLLFSVLAVWGVCKLKGDPFADTIAWLVRWGLIVAVVLFILWFVISAYNCPLKML